MRQVIRLADVCRMTWSPLPKPHRGVAEEVNTPERNTAAPIGVERIGPEALLFEPLD